MELRFYKKQKDKKPADGYPISLELPGNTVFAIHNWLQMHPDGRVEVRTKKKETNP